MIETIAVPVLMKAVDFLFDEAKKILQERRDARQSAERQAAPPPDIPLLDQDKQTVLERRVSEELAASQDKHQQRALRSPALIFSHQNRGQLAALFGSGGIYKQPGLFVKARGRPAGRFKQGFYLVLGQRVGQKSPRRPAVGKHAVNLNLGDPLIRRFASHICSFPVSNILKDKGMDSILIYFRQDLQD